MTPLQKIKILTNCTNDALINLYIEMTQEELKDVCKLTSYLPELDNVLVDIVVIKLNRKGNEGISSTNMNGTSESYLDQYPGHIKSRLKKYTNKVVMH